MNRLQTAKLILVWRNSTPSEKAIMRLSNPKLCDTYINNLQRYAQMQENI